MAFNTAKTIASEVAAILFAFTAVALAVQIPLVDVGSIVIGAAWVALIAVPLCAFRALRAGSGASGLGRSAYLSPSTASKLGGGTRTARPGGSLIRL